MSKDRDDLMRLQNSADSMGAEIAAAVERQQHRREIAAQALAAFIARGESAMPGEARAYAEVAVHYANALLAKLEQAPVSSPAHEALFRIRHAGGNTTEWAVWAQKTAAWGMEPGKWAQPPAEAPK